MAWVAPFDPFEALGLERNATPECIKSKYHELARRYHPNRNQGTDESKTALSEYFHYINQAWQLLSETNKRGRYIELLNLYDLHEGIIASHADLLIHNEHGEHHSEHHKSGSDGHVSSDADEDDLPHIAGIKRRQTFDQPLRSAKGLEDIPEDNDPQHGVKKEKKARSRVSHLRGRADRVDSGRDSNGSEHNVTAQRRKKLDSLRKKEYDTFVEYRDAMIKKFEAQETAERAKEAFERSQWRREYFERAKKETSQRLRLTNLFNTAIKAFTAQQQPVKRRKGSTISLDAGQSLSTGDPLQSNQFLTLPSRTKSVRRQDVTNDISIDQTSSEEEHSSDKNTSPHRNLHASHTRPNHRRHRSGDYVPSALSITARKLPNADQDPMSPIVGPGPRVIVRTPTSLQETMEAPAPPSDADSASAPSRSPPPEPIEEERGRFELRPHMSASELFACASERARSPSAERRSNSINGHSAGIHHAHLDVDMFEIKQLGHCEHHNVPLDHVHELTYQEKQWMLGAEPDTDVDPQELLKSVALLDSRVARAFEVKPDIKNAFKFRLIYSLREVVKNQHQSFIALSYRRKLHVEKERNHFTLPLEAEMFQAVWDERQSDREGVWIDQVCIDQDSDEEKVISMSAMDMVYRSARLVVVALDDIDLAAHEGQILQAHMNDYESQSHVAAKKRFRRKEKPYLDTNDDLYRVIRKMLRSSWFRRAWCRHEMRLARDHIFLVPCRSPGSWSGKSVLRFNGKFLTHLLGLATEVAFDSSIEAVKPALYAFFRDRSKLSPEYHLRSHHGNFTTVVAEVFAMEAGGDPKIPEEQREADARKDKISIILNTMECGLTLQQKVRKKDVSLPPHECNYMLLLLALAARDPGALCSVGHPFRELPYNLSSSWLLQPTNVDSGLNNYRTLNRLPEMFRFATRSHHEEHFVQLDLKFLSQGGVVRPLEASSNLDLARRFVTSCEKRDLGRNRKRYLINNKTANSLFGSMHDVYAQTLVCVFECGPDWMSEVCQRYGVSRWKYDLQPAYDLLLAFKNTNNRWPESAWTRAASGFLMDFVNFLVIRAMPQRQITQREEWRPVCVNTAEGGKVITFVPPGKNNKVAVPAALLDSDYLKLARLWVLEPRGEFTEATLPQHKEWTLLGKSVLFSDEIAMDALEAINDRVRADQKVFGLAAPLSDSD